MKSAFRFTILLSLLLHLLVFTPWFLKDTIVLPEKEPDTTVEFTLQPPPAPTPVLETPPETDIPPPPRHLEDDITKSNTSDGLAETPSGKPQPLTDGERTAQDNSQAQDLPADVSPSPTSSRINPNSPLLSDYLKAKEIAKQNMQKKGIQLQELTEDDLASNSIESPLNKNEEEKARWYNEVLKRIGEQVDFVWVKPEGITSNTWGVIRLDIDEYGYLTDAWVHLPSGNQLLDRSAMRAVRQVYRYDIPQSQKLSRHYRHLEFRYKGDEEHES
ncbi:MAG: outer membrane biosynthesis protein TonB [Oceanicoccus sp.]|jgi:outer membrane biosynthesis protein TonB